MQVSSTSELETAPRVRAVSAVRPSAVVRGRPCAAVRVYLVARPRVVVRPSGRRRVRRGAAVWRPWCGVRTWCRVPRAIDSTAAAADTKKRAAVAARVNGSAVSIF